MFVRNRMTTEVITLDPDQTLLKAMTLIQQKRIRHLPVVKEGKVLGIVTERDVRKAGASDSSSLSIFELNYLMDQIKVSSFMTKKVITVAPEEPIEAAAKLIYDHKIGALPVVDKNQLVGLITKSDILETFIEVLGINEPSVRVELELENRIGALADTTKVIKELGLYLVSLVTLPEEEGKKTRETVVRVSPTDEKKLKDFLRTVGPPIISVR
ncbi:MAG: CBS domain-containing protein [Deltaproteobacteria bacterium]|nr:CBS domain-containing protein [Deltaproteobacteria bacterium]